MTAPCSLCGSTSHGDRVCASEESRLQARVEELEEDRTRDIRRANARAAEARVEELEKENARLKQQRRDDLTWAERAVLRSDRKEQK